MKYMFLLFHEELPVEYTPEALTPWNKFSEDAAKVATFIAGDALQPSTTATIVTVRDDKRVTTDGPFATTKEHVGGYYVYDCPNLDVALDLASKIPWATTGRIEVRPIMEFS